jgi:hypothetical protein
MEGVLRRGMSGREFLMGFSNVGALLLTYLSGLRRYLRRVSVFSISVPTRY